jgi:hypothetical protein
LEKYTGNGLFLKGFHIWIGVGVFVYSLRFVEIQILSLKLTNFSIQSNLLLLFYRKMREDTTKVSPQSGVVSSTQFKTRCLEPDEEYLINEVVSAYRQSLEVCMEPPVKKDGPSFGVA